MFTFNFYSKICQVSYKWYKVSPPITIYRSQGHILNSFMIFILELLILFKTLFSPILD